MSDHDFTSRTIDNLEILFVTAIAVARHRANRDASLSFNLMGILNEITAVDDAVYFAKSKSICARTSRVRGLTRHVYHLKLKYS